MESKNSSTRGIQQNDVWSAADSLIADGQRPTIERVRQKLGRGSPNTVSPMLDAWFATLGVRLGISPESDKFSGMSEIFQQTLKDVWETVLSRGREESARELTEAEAVLMQATQSLNVRESEIDQIEKLHAVKQQAMEDALKAAAKSTENALARLEVEQVLTGRREAEIQNLQEKVAAVESELLLERRRHQEAVANCNLEKQRIEDRTHATQRRLLEDIDRARLETKKMASEVQASLKQFSIEKNLLQEKSMSCEKDLAKIEALYVAKSSDLEALRQVTLASELRTHELQNLLQTQLDSSRSTIARLTDAMLSQTDRADRQVKGAGLLVRKVSRPIRIRKG